MNPLIQEIQSGATPSFDTILHAWKNLFPLLDRLENTPQEPEWHGEGNVRIHTNMVLEQVYTLLQDKAAHLHAERRLALILGAVFHDIAKPLTTRTREIDGINRIVAPRHAEEGRSYLAYPLMQLGLPYSVTSHILALVGHHHDPLRVLRHDAPLSRFRRLARLVDLELVYFLEIADMLGRVCNDLQEQLDQLEMFRLYAEEYQLWNQPDPYAPWRQTLREQLAHESPTWQQFVETKAIWEAESEQIHTPEEAIARSYPARQGYPHVVITVGPSGSGKSTWIQKNLPNYHLISLDDLRESITGKADDQSANSKVLHLAHEQLQSHLRQKHPVIWDATNSRRDFRQPLTELSIAYGAMITYVVFHMTETTVLQRNQQRQRIVPASVIKKQLQQMQWPYLYEAHHTLFINDQGQTLAQGDCLGNLFKL